MYVTFPSIKAGGSISSAISSALDELILKRLARGDVVHDRTGDAQSLGQEVVHAAGGFLRPNEGIFETLRKEY